LVLRAAALTITLCSTAHGQTQLKTVNVGDATINYESTGQGRAIVWIHGWAQDLTTWDDQVAAFSPKYRVIRYDVRGFGESGGHADLSADPDDLRVLLDTLGIRSAYVVGLSRGATVALRFAVAFPDRVAALVLYGAPPPDGFQPRPPGPRIVEVFAQIARTHGLDSLGKVVYASPLVWKRPDQPGQEAQFQKFWARYRGRDLLDPRPESGRTPPARVDQLNQIRIPTLVIHGDHEMPLFQMVADTLVRRIPNARKVVIKDGGHGAHMYQPALFNKALADFFEEVDGRR
jgi:pimeloyl-ACP methyl ester carboxylesterase